MATQGRRGDRVEAILAVSGGADSVYLLGISRKEYRGVLAGHYNHGARGRDSDADQRLVERLCLDLEIPLEVGGVKRGAAGSRLSRGGNPPPRFEERAREARYAFLRELRERHRAKRILVAHTADDQVETVLMRILEGAGISGLKGIPRSADDGIERPLLDTWREDILKHLQRSGIPHRTDRSNFDTRFERNWIRRVLIPLLERRYGRSVKRRIFTLGERFREIDEFLGATARRWLKRNVRRDPGPSAAAFRLPRAPYSKLPSVVRKKVVQVLCFEKMKVSPNERLIEAMDRLIVSGRPSGRLSVGRGATLSCRYGEAVLRTGPGRDAAHPPTAASVNLAVREVGGRATRAGLRRIAAGERRAAFDADAVSGPFSVRPLRAGDRILPFGAPGKKKVKEVLIDRKIPRDERWGRPAVCDANGEIVWIPGVVRSSAAPVTRATRRTLVLELS